MVGPGDPWAGNDDAWQEAMAGPGRTRWRRWFGLATIVVVAVLATFSVWVIWTGARTRPLPPIEAGVAPVAAATSAPPSRPPGASPGPVLAPARLLADPSWVSSVAGRTGIPARALSAYAGAQLTTALSTPSCHLGWTMLAGIGAVESDHGRYGGSTLLPDGTTSIRILGPALDGTHGNKAIHATPAGVLLDGDQRWDHAVGPMQFIPSTWTRWGVSASGGAPDPNNIDDSALTAAKYLCAAGGDLATPAGWRAAIGAYNAPDAYAQRVTELADRYARASL